jgi:vacuolar-type H+-ATPase subunit F/Vma7
MGAVVFIGDELTATGFRLTGVETLTPEPADVAGVFADCGRRASLVIVTAEHARHIPQKQLEAALLADAPTVAVIPDVLARFEPPSFARRVKSLLGIAS